MSMIEKKPVIRTCATAHLDTIWNWDFETTIDLYIRDTLVKNFRLFEKYPDYVFSFEGSRRYELMEEYYPIRFEKLKKYIADGRWFVTGSAYENGDVNVPSPEALMRNILFGQDYFLFPEKIRQKERGYLPARLLRLRLGAAQYYEACRSVGLYDPKADLELRLRHSL